MELFKQVVKAMDSTEELLEDVHCKQLYMLEERMAEDIFILILCYYHENKGKKNNLNKELPYSASILSKDGKGLKFRVSALPEELQRIIVRYLLLVSC